MARSTDTSGAVPMRMAARDGPAWRTADTNATCDTPGTQIPTAKNGARSSTPAPLPGEQREPAGDDEGRGGDHRHAGHRVAAADETPPDGDRHRAEQRAGEQAEQDGVHQ